MNLPGNHTIATIAQDIRFAAIAEARDDTLGIHEKLADVLGDTYDELSDGERELLADKVRELI